MREIKFRAWDKENKVMQTPFDLSSNPKYWCKKLKDFPLMQYTGLKDKNGKEIYEGDIIKIFGSSPNHIEEIEWVDNGDWMGDKQPLVGFIHHSAIYKQPIEVIGNIYETPELLDNK